MCRLIKAPLCILGENPMWRADTEEFYWADIVQGMIYAVPSSGLEPAHPVLKTPYQIGAFLFTISWDLLLFTEQGVFLSVWRGHSYDSCLKIVWDVPNDLPFIEGERFNDAICGPDGHIMAGSKRDNNESGALYCFEPGRKPKLLLTGLQISNGMGFSPDGTIFYHTDSGPGTITAYHCKPNGKEGKGGVEREVINKIAVIYQAEGSRAVPDGMTVDAQGNIWTAIWGGGCVLKLSPSGLLLQKYPLKASQTSSVCFGGKNMKQLFVTSASIGSGQGSDTGRGGSCYLLSGAGCGKHEYRVRL